MSGILNKIKKIASRGKSNKIASTGSAGMSLEIIKNLYTSDPTFTPELVDKYRFDRVKFKGIC